MKYTSNNSSDETLDNFPAGAICIFVASTGLFVGISVGIFVLRLKVLTTQFALLCASLAGADCGVLACFLFWSVPMYYSKSPLSTELLGNKIGQLSLLFWFSGLYSTLAIALNRFLAISQPHLYRQWFSAKNTIRIIAICWILAVIHSCLYFLDGCDFFFDPKLFIWKYANTKCGKLVAIVLDLGYGAVFFFTIFVLNIATLIRIHQRNKELRRNSASHRNYSACSQARSSNAASIVAERQQKGVRRRLRREIRFFLQSCIHAVAFELMLISFHIISPLTTKKWQLFVTTSLAWIVSHSTNGFILLIFNRELRAGIIRTYCCLLQSRNNSMPQKRSQLIAGTSEADEISSQPQQFNDISVCISRSKSTQDSRPSFAIQRL